jgi:hypothetical protein
MFGSDSIEHEPHGMRPVLDGARVRRVARSWGRRCTASGEQRSLAPKRGQGTAFVAFAGIPLTVCGDLWETIVMAREPGVDSRLAADLLELLMVGAPFVPDEHEVKGSPELRCDDERSEGPRVLEPGERGAAHQWSSVASFDGVYG